MCTFFQLKAKDGSLIVGRTMEFGNDLQSQFYIHRRGAAFDASLLAAKGFGELAMTPWKARYGYIGLNAYNFPGVVDGINEAGLTVGALWLPGTQYQKVTQPEQAIPAPLMCDWALANFATVDEVIAALPNYQFWLPEVFAKRLPLHFPMSDATGNSIVIEFQDGKQCVYKNTVGVCTNAPWFPSQLDNLGNYVNLTPNDAAPITLGDLTVSAPGHGSGLNGLPGNATPPSRFVRTAYLKQFSNQPADTNAAYNLATHLLNNVDIGKGYTRDGKVEDYTQWAAIKNLTHPILAVRTYDSMVYRAIDLKKIDFGSIISHSFAIPAKSDMDFIVLQKELVTE